MCPRNLRHKKHRIRMNFRKLNAAQAINRFTGLSGPYPIAYVTCELVLHPWEITIFVSFSMQVKMPAYYAGSYGHLLPIKMDFRWPLVYPLATLSIMFSGGTQYMLLAHISVSNLVAISDDKRLTSIHQRFYLFKWAININPFSKIARHH